MSDRKEAALVCKHWYQASQDPLLLKDVVIRYCVSSNADIDASSLGQRRNPQLVLKDVSSLTQQLTKQSYSQLCQNLYSLSLHGTDVTESVFMSLLRNCCHLEVLDLSACNSLFMSGLLLSKPADQEAMQSCLVNMKELNLSGIHFLSDVSFNRLMGICPNLERLSLAGDRMMIVTSLHKAGSSTVLTFKNVSAYLNRQASKLHTLNLSRTNLNDEALIVLAKLPQLQLKELHLVACRDLTDDGIRGLCEVQKSLEVLDVSDCIQLTNSAVYNVAMHLINLRRLSLAQDRMVGDKGISKLRNLEKLEVINLSALYDISSNGTVMSLCTPTLTKLTSISLRGCHLVDDACIMELCKTLPWLERLELASMMKLSDVAVHHISSHLVHLKHLTLPWCQRISDFGLLGLEPDPEYLNHAPDVGLCKCQRRSNLTINLLASPLPERNYPDIDAKHIDTRLMQEECVIPISNLTQLRSLDLTSCLLLSDISMTRVMEFTNLQVLSLELCPKLTDAAIISICTANRTLEHLNISRCKGITDDSVCLAVEKLPRLTSLEVSVNNNLTDACVSAVYSHGHRLKLLDVSMCRKITTDAVENLEAKRPDLHVKKQLITEKCSGLHM